MSRFTSAVQFNLTLIDWNRILNYSSSTSLVCEVKTQWIGKRPRRINTVIFTPVSAPTLRHWKEALYVLMLKYVCIWWQQRGLSSGIWCLSRCIIFSKKIHRHDKFHGILGWKTEIWNVAFKNHLLKDGCSRLDLNLHKSVHLNPLLSQE